MPQTIAIAYLLTLFLFEEEAPKEKALQKENGRIRLRGERCYAQGATFKKVDKTIDGCCANTPTNPNLQNKVKEIKNEITACCHLPVWA